MNPILKYVSVNCEREFEAVKRRNLENPNNSLTIEEQTLIYKYTEDGYEVLNERLRITRGKGLSQFGKFLNNAIGKLPNYEGIAYRSAELTDGELKKNIDAEKNNGILVEHSFISASKSKRIAYEFGNSCQFIILSRTGKSIEEFAKYGMYHPQNEKEVLFRPNLGFKILQVTKKDKKTLVTLEEI